MALACGLLAIAGSARAEDEKAKAPAPVDPYARDPKAPVPPPGKARGWEIPPAESHRPEVIWIRRNTARGIQYTMMTAFAPLEGAQWLTRRFQIVKRVEDILYFGSEERSYGFLPFVSFQSGFGGGGGANLFHKDLFGHRERLAAKASVGRGNERLVQLSLDIPSMAGTGLYLEGLARYEQSNLFFYGIGNGSEALPMPGVLSDPRETAIETKFRQKRSLAMVSTGRHFGRQGRRLRLGVSAIYNRRAFQGASAEGDRSIDEVYDTSKLAAFDEGEDILELTAELRLDTRDLGGKTGSGLLLDSFVGGAPSRDGNQFLHYGLETSYFLTLFRQTRVLMLRLMHEGVEPRAGEVPFTELPRLGGVSRLRGYRADRFRDELSTVATLEYRYPIHHLVSGVLFGEAGKVARTYDELVAAGLSDNWKPAAGFGFLVHTLADVKFRLEISYGESLEVFFSTDALAAFRDRRRRL
jgi:hypothetical protein